LPLSLCRRQTKPGDASAMALISSSRAMPFLSWSRSGFKRVATPEAHAPPTSFTSTIAWR